MSQHTHSVKNIINGVSEQDPTIKLDNQVDEQINLNPDITKGLLKRNPTKLLCKTEGNSFKNRVISNFKYTNELGKEEICFLLLPDYKSSTPKEREFQIFRVSDNKIITINNPGVSISPKTYIEYLSDFERESIVIIEDDSYLYLLNKEKTVNKITNPVAADLQYKALVWVNNADYNSYYGVRIKYKDVSNVLHTVTYQILTSASIGSSGVTPYITEVSLALSNAINAGGIFDSNNYNGHFFLSEIGTNQIIDVQVFDTNTGKYMESVMNAEQYIQGYILNPATLPKVVFATYNNFRVRVSPNPANSITDYILRPENGVWLESAIRSEFIIDPTSFIHKIKKADITINSNSVYLKKMEILDRLAGDSVSNKDPSFIGNKINDIFLFNGRLGLLTNNTIVMSKVDDYSQFFKTTAATLRQDDRVDVKLDATKLGFNPMLNVSIINSQLLVNTGETQAALITNTAFDLTKSKLIETSSYSLGRYKPLSTNNFLIYFKDSEGITVLNDYKLNPITGASYISEMINKHCPNYIQGKPVQYIKTTNQLLVRTDADPRIIYVQNTYDRDGQASQNSFSKWSFKEDIEFIAYINNVLYIIFNKNKLNYTTTMTLNNLVEYKYKINEYDFQKLSLNEAPTQGEFSLYFMGEKIDLTLAEYSDITLFNTKLNTFSFLTFGKSIEAINNGFLSYTIVCTGFEPSTPFTYINSNTNPLIKVTAPATSDSFAPAYATDKRIVITAGPVGVNDNIIEIFDGDSIIPVLKYIGSIQTTYTRSHSGSEFNNTVYTMGTLQGVVGLVQYYNFTKVNYFYYKTKVKLSSKIEETILPDPDKQIKYRPYLDFYSDDFYPDLIDTGLISVNKITGFEYENMEDSVFNYVVYGVPFDSSVNLSKQVLRFQDQKGYTIVHFGNLFLRRFKLLVDNTGTFHVRVKQSFRDDKVQVSNPSQLGLIPLNLINPTNRVFTVYSNGNTNDVSIEVFSDNSQPLNFIGFEWLAILHTRGRRI